jgi:hypothetical protein
MNRLTKSPLRVASQSLLIGTQALRRYAHRFSPKLYTQAQLFACLVLKTFLKTDYRGVVSHLRDHSDLRLCLALQTVPHFTTLHKASKRLLRARVRGVCLRVPSIAFSNAGVGFAVRRLTPPAWIVAAGAFIMFVAGTAP